MTASVSAIAERALRRLNVRVVPLDDSPTMTQMVPAQIIANGVLVELGVIATDEVPPSQAAVVLVDAIATTALIKLGVIASDETPSATDLTLSRNAVNAVHAALVAQGSVEWTSSQISTAVSEEYAGLTAFHIASSFGKASDPAIVPLLEGRIAQVSRVQRAYALALSKVVLVHAALDAQATVWWTGDAVPLAFAEEYTKLAAAYAASSFGKAVDPAVVAMLEGRVRKGAAVLASHDIAVEAVMAVHTHLVARGMARWTSQDIPELAAMPYEMLAAAEMAPKFGQQVDPAEMLLATRQLAIVTALPTSGERVMVEYF